MRYWWVNQNQTHRQEQAGGYLWSPKRNTNGAKNPFYEAMREVAPSDVIFAFVDTFIAAIGVAQSYCWESPKPAEFGTTGQYWGLYLIPLEAEAGQKKRPEIVLCFPVAKLSATAVPAECQIQVLRNDISFPVVISQQVCCRAVSGLSLLFEILLRWFLSLPSSAPQDHDAASIAFRTVSAISVTVPANASTLFFKTAYFGIKALPLRGSSTSMGR